MLKAALAKTQATRLVAKMDANQLADNLGIAPLYKQRENQRWNSALQIYQEIVSNSAINSPREGSRTPAELGLPRSISHTDRLDLSQTVKPAAGDFFGLASAFSWAPNMTAPQKSGYFSPPQVKGPSGIALGDSRRSSNMSPGGQNTLELEAVAAVHELSFAVKSIYVSDMLPRTAELIFVNVTTLEDKTFCLELTASGWRVTSLRHDCMNGDVRYIDLHTKYFESAYSLMEQISPSYRNQFSEALAQRLKELSASRSEEPPIEEKDEEPHRSLTPVNVSPLAVGPQALRVPGDVTPNVQCNVRVTVRHPSGDGKRQVFPERPAPHTK